MRDFHDLKVWEKAHTLTLEVYRATRTFPQEERYGLTSQLRRSVASVPANISEGCGRDGDAELRRFLQIAMGSAAETEYHLLLARDLLYLDEALYQGLNDQTCEVKRMLASLIRKTSPPSGHDS
jgi:four helix bundle protein